MDGVSGTVPVPWHRYVALGDSFTEGLWDPHPHGPHELRGWADRLAERLSETRVASGRPPLEYANLAVRGRLLPAILSEQVPRALALAPDLVSLIGGGNDILRPSVDVDALATRLEAAVVRLRSLGIDVLLGTGMDVLDSPLIRATRPRIALLNAHIWSIARRHGAYVLDVWGMRSLRDWRMWDADRIHLTAEGHARVTQAALVALGLPPDDPRWDDPLAPLPPVGRAARVRADFEWMRTHVYPWATRRVRRRSSGRDRLPKRPSILPISAAAAAAARRSAALEVVEPLDVHGPHGEDVPTAAPAPQPSGPAEDRPGTTHDDVRGPATRGPAQ